MMERVFSGLDVTWDLDESISASVELHRTSILDLKIVVSAVFSK